MASFIVAIDTRGLGRAITGPIRRALASNPDVAQFFQDYWAVIVFFLVVGITALIVVSVNWERWTASTKRCEWCAEEVRVEAIKCKHCGSTLSDAHEEQVRQGEGQTVVSFDERQRVTNALPAHAEVSSSGDAVTDYMLAGSYALGVDVPQDDQLAAAWCRKAAEQGLASAEYSLGCFHVEGTGVQQDDEQAVFWLRKAAEQGHAAAQFKLAQVYQQMAEDAYEPWFDVADRPTGPVLADAVTWYRSAAELGNADAQNRLGWMYLMGYGVEENHEQAVTWLCGAAEQGQAMAQSKLGMMYREGDILPQDDVRASAWLRKAAERGSPVRSVTLQKCTRPVAVCHVTSYRPHSGTWRRPKAAT